MNRVILSLLFLTLACLCSAGSLASLASAQTPATCTPADTQCTGCNPGAVCCKLSEPGGCIADSAQCDGTACAAAGCQIEDFCVVGSAQPHPQPQACGADIPDKCKNCSPGDFCCETDGQCIPSDPPNNANCQSTACYSAAGCDGTQICEVGGDTPTPTPAPTSTAPGTTPAPTASGGGPTPTGSSPTPTPGSGPTPAPGACRTLKFVNATDSEEIWIGGKGGAVVPSCILPTSSCLADANRASGDSCACSGEGPLSGKLSCPSGSSPARNGAGALICLCDDGGGQCGGSGSQSACAKTGDGNVCFWTLPEPSTHGSSANKYLLKQGESATFCIPKPADVAGQLSPVWWSGGAFARTGCKEDGTFCATGDCLADVNGACPTESGGAKPLTLAEFTLQSFDKDFYDVTIIDGVNLSVTMAPIPPTRADVPGGADADYWCRSAGSSTASGNLQACSWSFDPFVPDGKNPSTGTDQTALLLNNSAPCDAGAAVNGCLQPSDSKSGKGTSYCTAAFSHDPQNKNNGGACLYPCTSDDDCKANWGGSMKCREVEYAGQERRSYCQCDEQSDCADSSLGSYCGTQSVPGIDAQLIQSCGKKPRGWWAANNFCAQRKEYGALQCGASIPNGDGGSGDTTTLQQLFACTGVNAQSCYNQSATSNDCCGCATGSESPFASDWPSAASQQCKLNNPSWYQNAQPWLVFLKQGCPTAYTYPYDDATSTFTCQSPGAINEVGYTITFGSLKAPSKCTTTSATASTLAESGDDDSACTAFLSRAVGYRGSLRTGTRWSAPSLTIADWVETASFSVGRPRGVIVRESSPDDVVWLSYPLARRRGTPERSRRGIVASDELGTHLLDAVHAERLLVPTGATSGDVVPAVPQAGLFDSYKCYRVKPAAGAAQPRLVSATYTDQSGPQQVLIRDFPDSLCTEADLGEGVGHELAQVACYRIRSDRGDTTRAIIPAHDGAGRLPITRPHSVDEHELTVSNRFGTAAAERGGPEEICVPIEVTDRGR